MIWTNCLKAGNAFVIQADDSESASACHWHGGERFSQRSRFKGSTGVKKPITGTTARHVGSAIDDKDEGEMRQIGQDVVREE